MTKGSFVTIQVNRRFDIPAERVFDAWIDPTKVREWMMAPGASEITRMEIDARVGGKFCFVVRRQREEIEHVGEYLELVRPRRLVFTWSVPRYSKDASIVNLDFATVATGTDLTLTHERVLEEYGERTEHGWNTILDVIAATVGSTGGSSLGGPGGKRARKVTRTSLKAS